MEYESDFFVVLCGICGNRNAKILVRQELVLVRKLFQCISLQHPSTACPGCLHKLYNFKAYLKELFLNQTRLVKTMDEEHKNGINCKCLKCQQKYGGLPLLVQVIEKQSKSNEPRASTSSYTPLDSSAKNKKLMTCSHCDKTFTHKGDLNKHQRTHTGEQPFSCSVCDRRFSHTSNLARHMRLHSGDRPFTCDICNKNFSRKDKLEQHRRSCKK